MAVMSCGPAFLALVVESLAAARARARASTPSRRGGWWSRPWPGTATWLRSHGNDTADLRRRVATPGGLTERGLKTLEREGLPEALTAAVDEIVEAVR